MTTACALSRGYSFAGAPPSARPAVHRGITLLWKEAAVIAIVLGLLTTGRYAEAFVMGGLIVWACLGTHRALQSLSLSVIVVMANQDVTGEQSGVGLLKWLLVCVALARVLADSRDQPPTRPAWAVWFGLFFVIALGLVFFENRNPLLSVMKLVTFSAGALAALIGMRNQRYPPQYWLNWFTTVYAVVLALSVPLIFVPSGSLVAYLAVELFRRPRTVIFPLTGLAAYCLFLSGCRTAFMAAGTALVAAIACLVIFRQNRRKIPGNRYLALLLCAAAALIGSVVILRGASLGEDLLNFLVKSQWDLSAPVFSNTGVGASRVSQVNQLVNSIADHPVFGIGFGLGPADADQVIELDEVTGLPTGAPSEQGFLPLAVLVQVGMVGAAVLLVMVLVLVYPVAKCGDPTILALLLAALLVNFGEMVFFAIGGLGIQMWLLVGLCHEAGCRSRQEPART